MIKKLLIIIFLLTINIAFALPGYYEAEPIYGAVKVVIYDKSIKLNDCAEQMFKINYSYWDGIKVLKVYTSHPNAWAHYFDTQVMHTYSTCDVSILMHELAHHKQNVNRENLIIQYTHKGKFCKYLTEIYNTSNIQHDMAWWRYCGEDRLKQTGDIRKNN